MSKRTLSMMLVLASVICLVSFCFIEERKANFSDYVLDGSSIEQIKSQRSRTDKDLIKKICFDRQELARDIYSNTFYYSVDPNDSMARSPKVILNEGDSDVRLAVSEGYITDDMISENETIMLTAYTDTEYRVYYLKITTLPVMTLECEDEESNEAVSMSMSLYDNSSTAVQHLIQSDGTMHVRGGTSRNYPKKGYKLNLLEKDAHGEMEPNKESLLQMRFDDDWILYAAYNDQEKVRNVFSAKLWHDSCAKNNGFGIDNGIEYQYVELIMNGKYHGLYALGYPVDSKQLGVTDQEHVYKKAYWDAERNVDYSLKGKVEGYEIETEDCEEAWEPLRQYYANFYSMEPTDSDVIRETIDMGSAVDTYIFFNLIQGSDHVNNQSIHNVYITAKQYNGSYKMLYTPWDMDQTWGNIWSDDDCNKCAAYGVDAAKHYVLKCGAVHELIEREDENMTAAVSIRYRELRNGKWSDENINKLIDAYEEDIYQSGAYLRDMERWTDGTYQDPDLGLQKFREYVQQRLQYTDKYYQ